MSSQPEVSLVMPVWRPRRDWLRAAVTSALGQRDCDLELIVVDDGSDEPVATILGDLNDDRLRVVRIPHAGRSAARNAGTAEARGRYIRYVDADDVLAPGGTRALLDHVDPHLIAHASTMVCDEQLVPSHEIRSELEGDVAAACLLSRFEVRHVSMLFPIEIVRAAGPWDPTISNCHDWDFVLRCVELAPVRATHDVVTWYRRHAASLTRTASSWAGARHGQHRVIEKYFERHPEARGTDLEREAWVRHHHTWARNAIAAAAPRPFVADALALTRRAPREAVPVWREAVVRAARGLAAAARRRRSAPAEVPTS